MRRRLTSLVLTLAAISACQAATPALEQQFEKTVRPFVANYCARCHSGPSPAAQFDLKSYTALDMVARDYPRWALVIGHRLERAGDAAEGHAAATGGSPPAGDRAGFTRCAPKRFARMPAIRVWCWRGA